MAENSKTFSPCYPPPGGKPPRNEATTLDPGNTITRANKFCPPSRCKGTAQALIKTHLKCASGRLMRYPLRPSWPHHVQRGPWTPCSVTPSPRSKGSNTDQTDHHMVEGLTTNSSFSFYNLQYITNKDLPTKNLHFLNLLILANDVETNPGPNFNIITHNVSGLGTLTNVEGY